MQEFIPIITTHEVKQRHLHRLIYDNQSHAIVN